MSYDSLIDHLTDNLTPVRHRRPGRDALIVAAVCATELAIFLALGLARPDMPAEMGQMSFWWRLSSLAVIAPISGAGAIVSFNPARRPKRSLQTATALLLVALALGWVVGAGPNGAETILQRLDWRHGVQCAGKVLLLSIPPLIGLGIRMRRGAATDAPRTALLAGLAAAAWGAFVFVFACPFNDPLYVGFWYLVGGGAVTLLARLALPPLTRW